MTRERDAETPEIASGYRFRALDGLELRRERARVTAARLGLKGTVLLAPEGVNFSVWGRPEAIDGWLGFLDEELDCGDVVLNRQPCPEPPFLRLKVRLRPEIVTFDPDIDPHRTPAVHVEDPTAWNRLLTREDVQVVDTRNDYEVRIGSFEGARNPGTGSFAEFKDYVSRELDPDRPVAMFCTGGVRCEKAGAWLRSAGFDEVYQLHGGILGYLARVSPDASRWNGECFVFDDRVSVDASLEPTGRVVCIGCREPAAGIDESGVPPFDDSGRCRICERSFDAAQVASLRERARQVRLAAERGERHLGPQAGIEGDPGQ
ncbi:MAG: rhodanese-like domain-containing protein [Wenzhouxiangellaceae bacterium]|nr:rhodanese-like domain-containing protein [Wenzhouxiangellaceae bacterium]